MANYILWGKDPKTGLNAQQEGICNIDTKHGTWDKDNNLESLEELMEQPTFNEATFRSMDAVPLKIKRETFSRKEALEKCPEYMRETYTQLFRQIDELDLAINYYDLAHNRRKNPPRAELLQLFTEEEQENIRKSTESWNQFRYLKYRHQLVELRQEQYTLRDMYKETVNCEGAPHIVMLNDPDIDEEIEVLPLGVFGSGMRPAYLFRTWANLVPNAYDADALKTISDYYWQKQKYKPSANQYYIDFRELEHVYQLFMTFFELQAAAAEPKLESKLGALLNTLKFYTEQADLNEVQKEILDLKMKKVRNEDIAIQINKKYNKTYTPNYISTIFRQRIIPKINEAAAYHEKVVSNLFFEEEFKACSCCGQVMLKCPENFTRKSRSKDGYTSRCKKCEKLARNK